MMSEAIVTLNSLESMLLLMLIPRCDREFGFGSIWVKVCDSANAALV